MTALSVPWASAVATAPASIPTAAKVFHVICIVGLLQAGVRRHRRAGCYPDPRASPSVFHGHRAGSNGAAFDSSLVSNLGRAKDAAVKFLIAMMKHETNTFSPI